MKIGTQKLKYTVENILYENHIINGRRRIANEIVDTIMEMIGDDMNLEFNLGHGFPPELESIVRKLERGLGLMLKRDEDSIEVYKFIKEQEQNGRSVDKFIQWATSEERARFIAKYRNSPGLIKIDYAFAFETDGYNPQKLEVGF